MKERQQSTSTYPLVFLLVSSTDHTTPLTGAAPTATLSKNGGAFAPAAGAVAEIGSGWYAVAGNVTDTGTLGPLILHATATGADPADQLFTVVPYNPFDAMLGFDGVALPSSPVANTHGEAWFLADLIGGRIATAQGGTTTTLTLDAGASADVGAYVGDDVYLYGGTGGGARGTGQRRTVVGYNPATKVATVHRAWDTVPDGTTKFVTMPAAKSDAWMWQGVPVPAPATAGVPSVSAVALPAIPANWITAAGINAGALNGKGDWLLSTGYTAPNNTGIGQIVAKLPTNIIADETLVVAAVNAVLAILGTPAGASVSADVAAVNAAVGSVPNAAAVKAQVVAALSADTYAEPTGAPGATVSIAEKVGRLYQMGTSKITVTASSKTFYSSSGTQLWAKALSDDGTTYTEAQGA